MKAAGSRLFFFRIILFLILVILLESASYTAMWFNSRSFDWLSNKNYFRVRAMLMGNKEGDQLPRYLTLPYLGYVPYPGYAKNGVVQHNRDGYRGTRVPLIKTHKFRVLCLGGSTTYGLGVNMPTETYPAQLEAMLNKRFLCDAALSGKYAGVEVINAGLEAGNSAEELQQYLFKYRYYNPDVVVVHSGINDAELMGNSSSDFQLDYTHYRRLQFHLEPLPAAARWLMKSYFLSFFTIRLFYENFYYSGMSGRECYTRQQGQTFCQWSTVNLDSVLQNKKYEFLPFYRNTKTLFEEIVKDSAALIVLPNILNPTDHFVQSSVNYSKICNQNVILSQLLARQTGGINVPFSFDSIHNRSWWLDDCHLNALGEKNKAQILLPYILQQILRK